MDLVLQDLCSILESPYARLFSVRGRLIEPCLTFFRSRAGGLHVLRIQGGCLSSVVPALYVIKAGSQANAVALDAEHKCRLC